MRKEKFGNPIWVGVIRNPNETTVWTFLDGRQATDLVTEWNPNGSGENSDRNCARVWSKGHKIFDFLCGYKSGSLCQMRKNDNIGVDKCTSTP